MRFWLDTGVDGLRLDAIPYLIEREGTNCENLPETHDVIKKIRAEIDARYPDRMLLAEANQWPEDVSAYFGQGDECHMCFHFPLMPRIYMAIAQEDRHPITDIMRQTPEIPGNCQWAIFLRNHDELTLEMVTERERDYLWSFYAADPRMRINLGIRRRLAPLLNNDRQKIELLNSLLLSMPGTPVLYYGDEIGMGDNVYLGDRDGVRTPMQWSSDRNGGFSTCDPQRLYLPPIMDPIYGYNTVNVEAQVRSPSSLLNWMKRLIAVCKQHSSFGLGTLKFLYPGNRKVLAYLREHEGESLLCIANLSRAAQAVELDLSRFKGRVPVELLGRSPFPPIGDLPYLLTLPGYGFYWFVLPEFADAPRWHDVLPEPMPEFTTLVMRDGWNSLTSGREAHELSTSVLPGFIAKQRWFAAKDDKIARADTTVLGTLGRRQLGDYLLLMATLELQARKETQSYFLPLDVSWDEAAGTPNWPLTPFTLAKARRGSKVGAVYDAFTSDQFVLALIDAMRQGDRPDRRRWHHPLRVDRGIGGGRPGQCAGNPPHRRGAEQQLGHHRRPGGAQDLPPPLAGRASGTGDRALPDRSRALREYAALARHRRADRKGRHAACARHHERLCAQPGRWLGLHHRVSESAVRRGPPGREGRRNHRRRSSTGFIWA